MINLSYAPTKGEYTKYSIDGADQLPSMTTSQKEEEYVDSIDRTSSDTPSDSTPSQYLKTPYSFGSLGLKFGLRFQF